MPSVHRPAPPHRFPLACAAVLASVALVFACSDDEEPATEPTAPERDAAPAPAPDARTNVDAAHDAGSKADAAMTPDADAQAPPTSTDGIQNGAETDVDCGGEGPTDAGACTFGKKCVAPTDCTTGLCTAKGRCSRLGRLYAGVYNADKFVGISSASTADGTTSAATSIGVTDVGGIAIDTGRDLAYVASYDKGTISVFSPASSSNGPAARTIGGVGQPWGVAVDEAADRLYATSFTDVLSIYDTASTRDGSSVTPNRQVNFAPNAAPYGLAYDAAHDRLFVSFRGFNRIGVFDNASTMNGAYASVVSRAIEGVATKLNAPSQLAYDAARDALYVANTSAVNSAQVVVFANVGTATGNVTPRVITTGSYNDVSGLALDPTRDELYISTQFQLKVPVYANASTLNGAATTSREITGFSQFASQLALDLTRD